MYVYMCVCVCDMYIHNTFNKQIIKVWLLWHVDKMSRLIISRKWNNFELFWNYYFEHYFQSFMQYLCTILYSILCNMHVMDNTCLCLHLQLASVIKNVYLVYRVKRKLRGQNKTIFIDFFFFSMCLSHHTLQVAFFSEQLNSKQCTMFSSSVLLSMWFYLWKQKEKAYYRNTDLFFLN